MLRKNMLISAFILTAMILNVYGASIPQLINYQGVLLDGEGDPISGNRSIEFLLYDVETEGTEFWSEVQEVTITDGLFNVLLGSHIEIPPQVFDSTEVYLALKVEGDEEMTPRKRLVSVGYAFQALNSDSLNGYGSDEFVMPGQSNVVTTGMILPEVLSSIDGVSNDGGNVDLVEGSNITITPDDAANTITISAASGSSGDDLGNHKATENIMLNGYWLSNNGDDVGIRVSNVGRVGINAAPFSSDAYLNVNGDIRTNGKYYGERIMLGSPIWLEISKGVSAEGGIYTDDVVVAALDVRSVNGSIKAGSPFSSYSSGDVAASGDLVCDGNANVGGSIVANYIITTTGGRITTGTPVTGSIAGDIVASGDLKTDNDVYARNNVRMGDNLIVEDRAGINRTSVSTSYEFYVEGTGYATTMWKTSDLKFKKDITDLNQSLPKLMALRGVSYNWKKDEFPNRGFDHQRQLGIIAQELESVFPELVKEDENGDKAVNYDGMIPVLLEAIKEQQQMIEDLQQTVNQLVTQ